MRSTEGLPFAHELVSNSKQSTATRYKPDRRNLVDVQRVEDVTLRPLSGESNADLRIAQVSYGKPEGKFTRNRRNRENAGRASDLVKKSAMLSLVSIYVNGRMPASI